MLGTVFAKTLRDQRRSYPWWVIGFVGTVAMYASVWPSVGENAKTLEEYMQSLPDVFKELIGSAGGFTTPEGYLASELFSLLGPILLLVYAIGAGARAIAGEEEGGSLDVLLSTPVRRRRVCSTSSRRCCWGRSGWCSRCGSRSWSSGRSGTCGRT
jgi:ABC-2 type transport system permease protein